MESQVEAVLALMYLSQDMANGQPDARTGEEMSSSKRRDDPRLPAPVRNLKLNDRLALAGVVIGILVVALGLALEPHFSGVGLGLRALGGVIFLFGVSAFVLGDARRRAAAQNKVRQIFDSYMSRTADWGWPDRWGLAAVAIGLILAVPMVALQIMFDTTFGVVLVGVILFWAGVGLLIYGRFYKKDAIEDHRRTAPTTRTNRGGRRGDLE